MSSSETSAGTVWGTYRDGERGKGAGGGEGSGSGGASAAQADVLLRASSGLGSEAGAGAGGSSCAYFQAKVVCCSQLVYDMSDLACSHYEAGDYEAARLHFESALARAGVVLDSIAAGPRGGVDPQIKTELERLVLELQLHLVAVHMRSQNTQTAEHLCEALLLSHGSDLFNSYPELLVKLLWRKSQILCVHRQYAAARDILLKALEIAPAARTIRALLAEVDDAIAAAAATAAAAETLTDVATTASAMDVVPADACLAAELESVSGGAGDENHAWASSAAGGDGEDDEDEEEGMDLEVITDPTMLVSAESMETAAETAAAISPSAMSPIPSPMSPMPGAYTALFEDMAADLQSSQRARTDQVERVSSELVQSGEFGGMCFAFSPPSASRGSRTGPGPLSVHEMVLGRAGGVARSGFCADAQLALSSNRMFLPSSFESVVDTYPERVYGGRWSHDGTLFYTAAQDWRIRVYDTRRRGTEAPELVHDLSANLGRWTLTDVVMARDNSFVAYSSITPVVYLAVLPQTGDDAPMARDHVEVSYLAESGWGGVWSLALSPDDATLLAGTSSHALVGADIQTGALVTSVQKAHADDINSVTYASLTDDTVVVTGSDDTLIKAWDLRDPRVALGVLPGHLEGVASVAAKGDGRYILSNGKDQKLKLWDLRKSTIPVVDYEALPPVAPLYPSWDYISTDYPGRGTTHTHPHDTSLMSTGSHKVLQTLIGCGFSPEFTTGSRYVYSGSHDGLVYIYDTAGEVCSLLDPLEGSRERAPIRGVAWHPYDMRVYTSSWSGDVCSYGIKRS